MRKSTPNVMGSGWWDKVSYQRSGFPLQNPCIPSFFAGMNVDNLWMTVERFSLSAPALFRIFV